MAGRQTHLKPSSFRPVESAWRNQIRSMLKSGQLKGTQIGGRNVWRTPSASPVLVINVAGGDSFADLPVGVLNEVFKVLPADP